MKDDTVRDKWYSDSRDHVKWGVLVHLCHKYGLRHVLQVAFYQKENPPYLLTTRNRRVPLPEEVWSYFCDIRRIRRLGTITGLDIKLFCRRFDLGSRNDYFQALLHEMKNSRDQRKAVLLDPDTGLAPKTASRKHVTGDEVEKIWKELKRGDWLVLYQHASRKSIWTPKGRKRFADACGLEVRKVQVFRSPGIASNVAFFAVQK